MERKWKSTVALVFVMVLLTGCQPSPAESIIENKDIDKMLEEATKGNSSQTVLEQAQNVKSYQTELQNKEWRVTVTVDAQVDVPEAEKMSIYRVEQAEIMQEFVDLARETLAPGVTWYEGNVLYVRTKAEYEAEIAYWKKELASVSDPVVKAEYQDLINQLQKGYEAATEDRPLETFSSDGLLHSVEPLYKRDTTDGFYSWEYSLNPDGEVLFAVSDGNDGNYYGLFAQNNPERGNLFRFRKCSVDHEHIVSAVSTMADFQGTYYNSLRKIDNGRVGADETVSIGMTEAMDMANQCIEQMGLNSFVYYEGGLFREEVDNRWREEGRSTRNCFILRYMRSVDGVCVTFSDEWQRSYDTTGEANFRKRDWPTECIEIRITDEGIVGFDYYAPMEIKEVVVDQSSIKSWEEIAKTFEEMILIAYAQNEVAGDAIIQIDRIRLGYVRINEPDNFESGLLIPAWDFFGQRNGLLASVQGGNFMTINAIDGSIIDRMAGY